MKQKTALVLSGGGARGIAHIGAIEELEQQGYEITSLAGTYDFFMAEELVERGRMAAREAL